MEIGSFLRKSAKQGDTKRGAFAIVSGGGIKFFEFFLKAATQLGNVLDITPIEGVCFFREKLKTGATKWGGNLDSQW